jgi:photosystem II stability/assembly factor-like uncharacterized protein
MIIITRNRSKVRQVILSSFISIAYVALISGTLFAQQFKWTRHTLGGGGGQPGIAVDPENGDIAYVTNDLGGIIKTTNGGKTWFPIHNNIGNRNLSDIEIDPLNSQVLYVTALVQAQPTTWSNDPPNGELYRTRNGGQSWEIVYGEGVNGGSSFSINNWPSCRNIAIPYDPEAPSRYDKDGDRITDVIIIGGWVGARGGTTNAANRSGIWKSNDEGRTFRQVTLKNRNIYVVKFNPNDPNIVYAGTSGDGLYRSNDGGETWKKIGLGSLKVSDIAIVPHKNIIYVGTDGGGVYKSKDGGANFTPINADIMPGKLRCIVVQLDKKDPSGDTIYAGFWHVQNGLYKSMDGGASWTKCNPERPSSPYWFSWGFSAMWALEQGRDGTFYATTWRGIYRYDRAKDKWMVKAKGLGNILVRDIVFEPNNASTAYLAISDSKPWKTIDGGKSWKYISKGFVAPDGGRINGVTSYSISPMRPLTVYATGGQSASHISAVFKTTDGGENWKPICNGLPTTSTNSPQWKAKSVAVSPVDPDLAFVTLNMKSGKGMIYRTADGGKHWSLVKTTSALYSKLAFSKTGDVVVTAGAAGRIYVGSKSGTNWLMHQLPTQTSLWAIDICPSDPDRIVVGANITGVFLTKDRGLTWKNILNKNELEPFMDQKTLSDFSRSRYQATIRDVKFDNRDPNTILIGHSPGVYTGLGILQSSDLGQTWKQILNLKLCLGTIKSIALDGEHILAGGYEICKGKRTSLNTPSGLRISSAQ